MELTSQEVRFLTALAREQNQSGCRGPAHEQLRKNVYPHVPTSGPGSLAFSYDAVPLIHFVIKDKKNLQEIDDFLRQSNLIVDAEWPWASAEDFRRRLAEARKEISQRQVSPV
jgi:hypothetical protein